MDRVIGDVAQLVEHLLCKQGVVGSIPSISTRSVGARLRSGGLARFGTKFVRGVPSFRLIDCTFLKRLCTMSFGLWSQSGMSEGQKLVFVRVNRFWCVWIRVPV